jgi:hypothetical protein
MASPQFSVEIFCLKSIHEFCGGVLGGGGESLKFPLPPYESFFEVYSPPPKILTSFLPKNSTFIEFLGTFCDFQKSKVNLQKI